MTAPSIRIASEKDLPAMLAIYSPYVTETTISFETQPPAPEEFARRFAQAEGTLPWLVAQQGGRVVGYAYASRFGQRAGYDWSAESSVYVDSSCHSQGVGAALIKALAALLAAQGYRNLYARVVSPNPQSEGFHKKLGFILQATLPRVGCKFGRWLDIAHYCLPLAQYEPNPAPPLALAALDAQLISRLLGG